MKIGRKCELGVANRRFMKERMEVARSRKGNDMRRSQRHMTMNDSDFQQRDDWHRRLRVHRRNYFYSIR